MRVPVFIVVDRFIDVAGSFVDQRPAPAAASMVHDPTTLEEESIKGQSWDFDDGMWIISNQKSHIQLLYCRARR
jgi:hypothetical protein